jgi:transposase
MRLPATVTLTEQDRCVLAEHTDSTQVAMRRQIVLLSAGGWFNVDIAAHLGIAVSTVALWRGRFATEGLAGLEERPRTGRPRRVDRTSILRATVCPSDEHAGTVWTSDGLADELQVSVATVRRTWQEYGVFPGLGGGFVFRVEPELTASAVNIVGICCTPKVRVAALVVGVPSWLADRSMTAPDRVRQMPTQMSGVDTRGRSARSHPDPLRSAYGLRGFLGRVATANAGQRIHLVTDSPKVVRALQAARQTCTSADLLPHVAVDAGSWFKLVQVWQLMAGSNSAADRCPSSTTRSLHDDGRRVVWLKPSSPDRATAS